LTLVRAALVALFAILLPQQTVFRTRVDAVRVDVLVTRGGRPVAGLTAADFDLRDNGVGQQIEAVALEDVPLNLLIALDMSTSMAGEPLRHLKDAAHAAAASLGANDRASVLTFSHMVQKRIPWSADTAAIGGAIDSLEAGGSTSLTDAAFAALALREGVDGRMLVLLFTDGLDTASWLDPLAVIGAAKRSDLVVVPVRLDSPANRPAGPGGVRTLQAITLPAVIRQWFEQDPQLLRQEFLPALADETGGDLIVASQSRDLRAVFVKIVAAFKTRYVLTYSPQNVPPSGWHPLDVRLKNKRGDVRARRGYMR
jgi:VWFA-related protein